jgi:hypothetical protein
MLRRVIGAVLVGLGGFQAALSARNLWIIHKAWNDPNLPFGIEFIGTSAPAETLRGLWIENLSILAVMVVAIAIGAWLLRSRKVRGERRGRNSFTSLVPFAE